MPFTLRSRRVYGDKCFTRPAIYIWCKKFACGGENVVDEKRPAQCVVLATDAEIALFKNKFGQYVKK